MRHVRLNILSAIMFSVMSAAVMPAYASEESPELVAELEMTPVTISVDGSTLHIKNAEGTTLEVYNLTGEKVYTQNIDSPSKSVELNNLQHGVYIVKVGKVARKVYLK